MAINHKAYILAHSGYLVGETLHFKISFNINILYLVNTLQMPGPHPKSTKLMCHWPITFINLHQGNLLLSKTSINFWHNWASLITSKKRARHDVQHRPISPKGTPASIINATLSTTAKDTMTDELMENHQQNNIHFLICWANKCPGRPFNVTMGKLIHFLIYIKKMIQRHINDSTVTRQRQPATRLCHLLKPHKVICWFTPSLHTWPIINHLGKTVSMLNFFRIIFFFLL